MTLNKKCNCCQKIHTVIPENARPWMQDDTYEVFAMVWECDCKSTLIHIFKQVQQESQAQAMMNRGGK